MKLSERPGQSMWSRRKFTKILSSSVLAAGSGLVGPAFAEQPGLVEAAKKEGRLAVYGDSSMVPNLVEGFSKRYPEIRVATVPGGGWQTYNRMLVEKAAGRMIADVLVANDDTALFGFREGVFGKVETTAGYPADSVSETGYVICYRMLTPIMYNREACKGLKMPKDWDDFATLGDEWKGLIISSDPRNSGTALCIMMGLYQNFGLERANKILAGLKRLGTEIAPNTGVQVAKLMSGEKPLTITMHTAFFKGMRDKGAPVDILLPESGSIMQVDAMAVPKDAPHPNAGRLFIDFAMSTEGATILAANGVYPAFSEDIVPAGLPPRKSVKVLAQAPADALRDRDAVIEWWKKAMGVS